MMIMMSPTTITTRRSNNNNNNIQSLLVLLLSILLLFCATTSFIAVYAFQSNHYNINKNHNNGRYHHHHHQQQPSSLTSSSSTLTFMIQQHQQQKNPLLIKSSSRFHRSSSSILLKTAASTIFIDNDDNQQIQEQQLLKKISTPTVNGATASIVTTNGIHEVVVNGDTTKTVVPWYSVLWQFTRPHTIIGSALAVPSLHALAFGTVLLSLPSGTSIASVLPTLLSTLYQSILYCTIPACLMNLYITGLNQITDIDIDRINKPYLPIAANILSKKNAIIIVLISLCISLSMGIKSIMSILNMPTIFITQGLQVALIGSGILGTLYSMKPFRFKRYPLLAAFCIIAVRGTIINASFYSHAKTILLSSISTSSIATNTGIFNSLLYDPTCFYSSIFYGVFGMIIALFKDIPDVKGDAIANIRTMSVRLGPTTIYNSMISLLKLSCSICSINFIYLSYIAFMMNNPYLMASRIITSIGSIFALRSIDVQSKLQVKDPTNSNQVYNFYMHLWKLFYLSYFLLPFAR